MILASSFISDCVGFTFRHPGLLFVLLGVIGEVACDWKEMDGRLARAKRLSALLLVFGLLIEFWEAAKSDQEVSRLNLLSKQIGLDSAQAKLEASQANERAENTESNNLILQSKLLKLEVKTNWRTIIPEENKQFIGITRGITGFPIRVRMAANASSEVRSFAQKIREMLDDAGFSETNKDLAFGEWPPDMDILYKGGLSGMPSVMFLNNIPTSGPIIDLDATHKTLKLFTNLPPTLKTVFVLTNTDSPMPPKVFNENGAPVVVIYTGSTGAFKMMDFQRIQSCFENIGITTEWMNAVTNLSQGVCEVFVCPKF